MHKKGGGVKNIFCSTFNNRVIFPNQVSSVGIFDVLEHIDTEDIFLQSIHTGLSHGGKLYITVPAHQWLWSESDNRGHCRRYCKKSLIGVLQKNGFRVLYVSYFFGILVIPIFLLRTIPYKIHKIFNIEKESIAKKSEFVMPKIGDKIIGSLFNMELKQIMKGNGMPFGASLIVVAEKSNK